MLLAFIGVKLLLHALHENELPFINGGEPIGLGAGHPDLVSLLVIVGTLGVTTVASLVHDRGWRRSTGRRRPRQTARRQP